VTLTRRQFLGAAGAAGALAATGGWRAAAQAATTAARRVVPSPDASAIEHIVVVMMENRSFDHFIGWMPGADGRQAGLTYRDSSGAAHHTASLSGEYMGCAHPDPDHSYEGGRVQWNGGAMDGWLHTGSGDDDFALGYYGADDRPFMSQLALNYTTLDRYFCSILAETFPNRFFMHAATTDRRHNLGTTSTSIYPTIWDRLAAKGVSHRYYFNDLPFLALWGQKYLSISAHYAQFLADASAGTLPAVSYVDPRFEDEDTTGTSGDDHPHADIRAGDHFLAEIFHTLTLSPAWSKTVLVVMYDEWGGFFDHVPPGRAAQSALEDIGNPGHNVEDPDQIVNGKALLGFRVPCIVASPFTRGRPTSPRVYGTPQRQRIPFDHTSVLKLIEWRHDLLPLTARDASSDIGNILDVLDFGRPDASVPDLPLPPPPPPNPCGPSNPSPAASSDSTWSDLRSSALLAGWSLP
jgi:phospholipase C